jgi:hypothetical protein
VDGIADEADHIATPLERQQDAMLLLRIYPARKNMAACRIYFIRRIRAGEEERRERLRRGGLDCRVST